MRTRRGHGKLANLDALTERFGLSDMLCALVLGSTAGVLLSWDAIPRARGGRGCLHALLNRVGLVGQFAGGNI